MEKWDQKGRKFNQSCFNKLVATVGSGLICSGSKPSKESHRTVVLQAWVLDQQPQPDLEVY